MPDNIMLSRIFFGVRIQSKTSAHKFHKPEISSKTLLHMYCDILMKSTKRITAAAQILPSFTDSCCSKPTLLKKRSFIDIDGSTKNL